jgi:hypothetical protein
MEDRPFQVGDRIKWIGPSMGPPPYCPRHDELGWLVDLHPDIAVWDYSGKDTGAFTTYARWVRLVGDRNEPDPEKWLPGDPFERASPGPVSGVPSDREQLIVFAREIGELYRLERSRNAELESVLQNLQNTYPAESEPPVICSFCRKSQTAVKKLIAGPTVYICNECIDLCNEIIVDDIDEEGGPNWWPWRRIEAPE